MATVTEGDRSAEGPGSLALALGLMLGAAAVGGVLGTIVAGEEASGREAGEGEDLLEEIGGGWSGWASLGLMVGTFFFGWARTGTWLTRPSTVLTRLRVDVHIWTSVGVLALALLHTVELLVLDETLGWLSGTFSTVFLGGLFVTGWWRRDLVDSWGLTRWRIVHWLLAVGAILHGVLHWMAIEGEWF